MLRNRRVRHGTRPERAKRERVREYEWRILPEERQKDYAISRRTLTFPHTDALVATKAVTGRASRSGV